MPDRKNFYISIVVGTIVLSFGYLMFEPGESRSASDNDQITVTQVVTGEISISSPVNITMSATIPGRTGNALNPATGQVMWTVITSNSSGFNLTLAAFNNPAMQNSAADSFANYTSSTSTPDFTWAVADGAAEFGYTVEPETTADTDQTFMDNGATCNTGAANAANSCWFGFNALNAETIVNRSSETNAGGEDELVRFRTEFNNISASAVLPAGTYTATITATATTN
ncbi:MAG: hypothetical protein A2445_05265 [Candidatus Jacksonbacteria bacterium RIFOXYC2_FULL_44_29]|nr:MAG: hypothetical protein UW45_C0034G0002 [Parcubacteria group bacterium GW2011_GWC2_44_22]OGY76899.1 MAG: hypothetical protein A2240_02075 [Candidatus Jacksonbacteria bacterium RIFOXYA2_FULL_43_12]OGY77124.1 MAG: hypothetical protein A2295_03485 [Candidatus Jacksonbacteria bacterium RIFOXYB2_FULL_44_15]OGY77239.1 MAG: hypothetical protein A2445_05265 [Candidatus Jacksonbacteria bacterium RIFOXYC2_FULL_44_29]OGY78417.1 MAG: hypothetical protein A2550_06380 [Candidatus Jacksonbacteria bacteri